MPPKGRVNLGSLVNSVGGSSPVGKPLGMLRENVPVAKIAPNPRNPRESVGDLDDLNTITERQLQPGVAISRKAWLELWPEDQDAIGEAAYVVVNGCRRLAACKKFGRPGMDIVVRDEIAESRESVMQAAIVENLARRDLNVVEEAKAVEDFRAQYAAQGDKTPSQTVGKLLGRSESWVAQRRAVLKLADELQDALRAGEMALREARQFAKVPLEDQVTVWLRMQEAKDTPADEQKPDKDQAKPVKPAGERLFGALRRIKAEPETVADAIKQLYDEDQVAALVAALEAER